MLYREALEIHQLAQSTDCQPDIIGDAFLLNENLIYRRIRDEANHYGVKLIEATTQYLLMPFNQLDQIVSTKQVPYVPSARLMKEVEAKNPGIFDLEQMPVPESYHLHESAHVIGEQYCKEIKLATKEDYVLKAILCESFANSSDALACFCANSEAHLAFLKLNCYMKPRELTQNKFRKVKEELGESLANRLVFYSYLFANFLHEEVPMTLIENEIKQVAKPKNQITEELLSECVALADLGQDLDPNFRLQTTGNYFQQRGYDINNYDFLNFDFMRLSERSDFKEAVDKMTSCLRVGA